MILWGGYCFHVQNCKSSFGLFRFIFAEAQGCKNNKIHLSSLPAIYNMNKLNWIDTVWLTKGIISIGSRQVVCPASEKIDKNNKKLMDIQLFLGKIIQSFAWIMWKITRLWRCGVKIIVSIFCGILIDCFKYLNIVCW